jgi:hypothetical protein
MANLNDYLPTAPQPAPHPASVAQPLVLGETIAVSEFSGQSKEILEHFGLEAPKLLNDYSCAVEDALIEQVKMNKALSEELDYAQAIVAHAYAICEEKGVDLKAEIINRINN